MSTTKTKNKLITIRNDMKQRLQRGPSPRREGLNYKQEQKETESEYMFRAALFYRYGNRFLELVETEIAKYRSE